MGFCAGTYENKVGIYGVLRSLFKGYNIKDDEYVRGLIEPTQFYVQTISRNTLFTLTADVEITLIFK